MMPAYPASDSSLLVLKARSASFTMSKEGGATHFSWLSSGLEERTVWSLFGSVIAIARQATSLIFAVCYSMADATEVPQ